MSLPRALANALAAAPGGSVSEATASLTEADGALAEVSAIPVDPDLAELAAHQEAGEVPLLGTDRHTQPYPALLWNGERFERLRLAWPARLAFVALAAAGAGVDRLRSARAVAVAEVLRRGWPDAEARAVAELTTSSVGAAVCAAIAAGVPDGDLEAIAELAAGLMLVTPHSPTPQIHDLHAGHAMATGWLAVQLFTSGVVAAPGTADEALGTRVVP